MPLVPMVPLSAVLQISTPLVMSIRASAYCGTRTYTPLVFGMNDPKPWFVVAKVSALVQVRGLMTTPIKPAKMGLCPGRTSGACVLYEMITPVSSALSANFKGGLAARYSAVTGKPITYAAIILAYTSGWSFMYSANRLRRTLAPCECPAKINGRP